MELIAIEFLYVGIGGFLGSCLRYLFTLICKNINFSVPAATLFSNVLAGALIGLLIGYDWQTNSVPPQIKLFFGTGFLGGLSTFSTFNIETSDLFLSGKYTLCILNVILNLSLSFLGVAIGIILSRSIRN